MTETHYESAPVESVEELAVELAELDPKPVTYFTPDNLDEVLEDFLSGKQHNPVKARYGALDALDFNARDEQYKLLLNEFLTHPDIPTNHRHVYQDFVDRALMINELMATAVKYRLATTPDERQTTRERFEELNKELYSTPQPEVAAAMVQEVLSDTAKITEPQITRIRDEFIELLPKDLRFTDAKQVNLHPSQEAKELIERTVKTIYRPLLEHADELISQLAVNKNIPESKLKLDPQAIAVIFQTIIDREFPDSGWKVVMKSGNAIYVNSTTKTITIPEKRVPATPNKVRGLVAHELGVHMLRSIIGEGSDLIPMRFGLAGVGDAEEGIAKVMESVMTDDDARTGYQHYLTAMLLIKGYDFRDTFEIMWRYKILDAYLNKAVAVDNAYIDKQKAAAAKFMFRSVRGTNELPWLTTLSYFVGSHKIWDYVDRLKGDPDLVTTMFMGKIDPTNPNHLWGAFDAKGRVMEDK